LRQIFDVTNSKIDTITFEGLSFLLKRDDLLDKEFTGNKARKFHYFLINNFPNITTVVSHGSNQSNAMYSLSVLAKYKGWNYIYYTHHIPNFLKENPNGNYKYSLKNGMKLKLFEKNQTIDDISYDKATTILVKEGGAIDEARYGIEVLANEIVTYRDTNNITNLKIFLPSGTGTTALFLQHYLKDIEVLTCPCVGDAKYLQKQFMQLLDTTLYPTIIEPKKKYHFGKLYKTNYETYLALLEQTNIEFDLLYDPVGIETFIDYAKKIDDKDITYLYIHQGGLKGNVTMIDRYQYKYKQD